MIKKLNSDANLNREFQFDLVVILIQRYSSCTGPRKNYSGQHLQIKGFLWCGCWWDRLNSCSISIRIHRYQAHSRIFHLAQRRLISALERSSRHIYCLHHFRRHSYDSLSRCRKIQWGGWTRLHLLDLGGSFCSLPLYSWSVSREDHWEEMVHHRRSDAHQWRHHHRHLFYCRFLFGEGFDSLFLTMFIPSVSFIAFNRFDLETSQIFQVESWSVAKFLLPTEASQKNYAEASI